MLTDAVVPELTVTVKEQLVAGALRCVAGGWAGELGGRAVGEVCPNSTSVNSNVPPTVRTLLFTSAPTSRLDPCLLRSLYIRKRSPIAIIL